MMNDTPDKPTAAPLPDWLATVYPMLSPERLAALPVRGADAAPWPPAPASVKRLAHLKPPLKGVALSPQGFSMDQTIEYLRHAAAMEARLCLDVLADALRRALVDILDRKGKDLPPEVLADLRRWAAEDANLDGLRAWLDRGGWDKVDGDNVEAALLARIGRQEFSSCGIGRHSAPPFVILYDTPRADRETPATLARIKKLMPEETPGKVLLGLDALRDALRRFDLAILASLLPERLDDRAGDWLGRLAVHWMDARRADLVERLGRQAAAVELAKAPAVHTHGRKFGRLPKVAAGMSWAFGGPGVELARVKVDGREYAPAPDLAIAAPTAALVPAGYALLPADYAKRAHQTLLPIDTEGAEDALPLPVALADATQYAIAPAGGKLGLLIMAAAHESRGRLHKTTLRELTQTINPDARLVRTHFETVCKVLPQLDGLRLVLPTGLAYRVFECPITWRDLTPEEYDLPLFVGLTRTFERTLAAIQDAAGASYRGDFLFDLTGTMKLPTRRPGLVRQYIRACAFWNAYWKPGTAGEPDPARVPEVSTERWAIMTNYLTPAAEEYLRANGKGNRRRLSDVLRDTLKDVAYLADEARLVKIDRADRRAVRLLWRPEYLEAWRESRKGAHKIPGNAPEA